MVNSSCPAVSSAPLSESAGEIVIVIAAHRGVSCIELTHFDNPLVSHW